LSEGKSKAAGIVKGAIEDFAQDLATVIRCFQRLEAWRNTECIVVGDGLRATREVRPAAGGTHGRPLALPGARGGGTEKPKPKASIQKI